MMKKGYYSELKSKEELIEIYGYPNVIKVAIGGAFDFLIICGGELIKTIEVKSIHNKKKYYPTKKDKFQFDRIIKFSQAHGCIAELWIYKFFGRGKPIIKEIKLLYSPDV